MTPEAQAPLTLPQAFGDFLLFSLLGCSVMILGHIAAQLRRRGTLKDAWNAHWVSALLGVVVVFGVPFLYGTYVVWRECDNLFIVIMSSITMFQMGVGLDTYALTVFLAPGSGRDDTIERSGDSR